MQATSSKATGVKKPKAPRLGGKIPKGKFTHIHIRRADNGGISVDSDHATSEKPKKGRGMLGMSEPSESHSAMFQDPGAAMAHLGQVMGAGGPPSPEAPPAPEGGAPAPGAPDTEAPEGED